MEKVKTLEYWRASAEEDYMHTPISVLKYITILEKKLGLPPDEEFKYEPSLNPGGGPYNPSDNI